MNPHSIMPFTNCFLWEENDIKLGLSWKMQDVWLAQFQGPSLGQCLALVTCRVDGAGGRRLSLITIVCSLKGLEWVESCHPGACRGSLYPMAWPPDV